MPLSIRKPVATEERLEAHGEVLLFAEGGIVLSKRLHTMCEAGDCLIQVAESVDGVT